MTPSLLWKTACAVALASLPAVSATTLQQGFLFDWNPPGTTIPVPITEQCAPIHITWNRGSAVGPNPVAPYYLEVYTSAFIVPFTIAAGSSTSFDWQVPFAPNTLYQICMFDSQGTTGGCQDIYTVITNTTTPSPSCANVTFPAGAMDVSAAIASGSFSQYGWINQCTDIAVTPKNGTPPYQLTVAPTLLPPINITSNTRDTINWTNTLQYGISYFLSLTDSEGNRWSQGPLHSSGGSSSCMADTKESTGPSTAVVAVGSLFGGLILGALLTGLGCWLSSRNNRRSAPSHEFVKGRYSEHSLDDGALPLNPYHTQEGSTRSMNSLGRVSSRNLSHQIEPFTLPAEQLESQIPLLNRTTSDLAQPPLSPGAQASEQQRRAQVYVLHHDGGRAPVTVYTDDGAEVTELPPTYADNRAPPRRLPPPQQRQVGELPRKPRRGGPSQPSGG